MYSATWDDDSYIRIEAREKTVSVGPYERLSKQRSSLLEKIAFMTESHLFGQYVDVIIDQGIRIRGAEAVLDISRPVYAPESLVLYDFTIANDAAHSVVLSQLTTTQDIEFVPTSKVVRHLLGNPTEEEARQQIVDSVFDLFDAMAESLRDSGASTNYRLGGDGRFDERVARALVSRVPVEFYSWPDYSIDLFKEVRMAARKGQIYGKAWKVEVADDGVLGLNLLDLPPKTQSSEMTTYVKAKSVKYAADPNS